MGHIKLISVITAMTLTLNGCGGALMKPLDMPAEGYAAVRFKQFVTVGDHSINTYAFKSGTELVQDRQMDGTPYYCGLYVLNNSALEGCFVFDGDSIILGYGSFKQVSRDLSGKIVHIRINPSAPSEVKP